jgi:Protein of unknown function (DUF3102)
MSGPILLPLGAAGLTAPELASELETVASRVRKRLGSLTANVIEVGHELQTVKSRLQHGQFIDWVETTFGLLQRMAQLMIKAAQWVGGESNTARLLEIPVSGCPETSTFLSRPGQLIRQETSNVA